MTEHESDLYNPLRWEHLKPASVEDSKWTLKQKFDVTVFFAIVLVVLAFLAAMIFFIGRGAVHALQESYSQSGGISQGSLDRWNSLTPRQQDAYCATWYLTDDPQYGVVCD